MGIWEVLLIGIGLSMDAFAVSVAKGLANRQRIAKTALACGLWFGAFQALMPTAGYLLGSRFAGYISRIDHWIAFALLALIGGNMIRDSRKKEEEGPDQGLGIVTMLILAIATSIDALAVGLTFAFLQMRLAASVLLIGATTFVISAGGACLGNTFGRRRGGWAKLAGGLILIAIGVRILVSHLIGGT